MTRPSEPKCTRCQLWPAVFSEGFCRRCFDATAPRGYVVCRLCGYERARGLMCGEPCV